MTEYNKVVYDGQTLIDLTQDDVQASDVRNGVYFHSADGVRSQGTLASTSAPTADTIAEWDSDAHMNSEDMTSQEVDDFVDSLDVTAIHAVDYVVEQGTEGIWTYRKWNSGTAECWGETSATTSFTAWTSPIYYGTTYSPNTNFPTNMFIATPKLQVLLKATGSDCWMGTDSSSALNSTTTGRYYPIRVGSYSGQVTFIVRFYAIGAWK